MLRVLTACSEVAESWTSKPAVLVVGMGRCTPSSRMLGGTQPLIAPEVCKAYRTYVARHRPLVGLSEPQATELAFLPTVRRPFICASPRYGQGRKRGIIVDRPDSLPTLHSFAEGAPTTLLSVEGLIEVAVERAIRRSLGPYLKRLSACEPAVYTVAQSAQVLQVSGGHRRTDGSAGILLAFPTSAARFSSRGVRYTT